MSFGGYKFSGHTVDNSYYSASIDRCLAIHAARVRAFLEASNLAGGPWAADPEWLNGEISLNTSTWVIKSNSSSGVIHVLTAPDGSTHGYSSYFKYSSGQYVGYYYIMTTNSYCMYNSPSGDPNHQSSLALNVNTILIDGDSYGPSTASCFHCLSIEPFGSDLFNIIQLNQKSTRLQSIGRNSSASGYQTATDTGFVGINDSTTQYGYAIKDKDVIVFSGSGQLPFYNLGYEHVAVMSLNGFYELYNKDDSYPFLYLDIKNYNDGTSEQLCNGYKGWADQVLSTTGAPLISVNTSVTFLVSLLHDARSFYMPSSNNNIPFLGIPIAVFNSKSSSTLPFTNSNQLVKGCTNPELVACNVSYTSLSNSRYSQVLDGSLMFLYNMKSNSYSIPNTLRAGNDFSDGGSIFQGYCNFYIGWDPSNPDIRSSDAWPEYNAELQSDMITIYRTQVFDHSSIGNVYYKIADSSQSFYGDLADLLGAFVRIYVDTSNSELVYELTSTNISGEVRNSAYNNQYLMNGELSLYLSDNTTDPPSDIGYVSLILYYEDGTVVGPYGFDTPSSFDTGQLEVISEQVPAPEPDMSLRTESISFLNNGYYKIDAESSDTTMTNLSLLVGASVEIYFDTSDETTYFKIESQTNGISGTCTSLKSSGYYYLDNEYIMAITDYNDSTTLLGNIKLILCNADGSPGNSTSINEQYITTSPYYVANTVIIDPSSV